MEHRNNLICPSCSARLNSERQIRIGKKITCPNCKIAFTVRPEDAEQAELGARANPRRLAIVLAGGSVLPASRSRAGGLLFHAQCSQKRSGEGRT